MKRKFYVLVLWMLVFAFKMNAQNVLQESFEGTTFPPTGWTLVNAGTGNAWTQNTTATYAYQGTKSMQYAYNTASAANAWAFTPALSLAAGSTYSVTFYVRVRSAIYPESMKFTVGNTNTVAAQTTTLLDSASITNVTFRKWATTYTPTTTGNYNFAFNCYSAANQFNLYVDSVSIFNNNAPSCTGAPAAGTISGPTSICSGVAFTLNNTGATTTGIGLSYAWQSSANGTTGWTNIAGQTSPTSATVSQTAATYYRFVDTCSASGQSAVSNVIQVTMNAATACYCTPVTDCSASDRIDSVSFVTIRNGSACSTNGYGDYTTLSAAISTGSSYPIAVKVGNGGTENVAVWIDYNQNGTFEASEFTVIGSGNGTIVNGIVSIPTTGVTLGTTRMRVRARYSTALTGADACLVYTYGETEDYTVVISAGLPCTGTPNGGAVTPSSTTLCTSGTVNLTSNATNTGTGITYQWQSSVSGANSFSDISGATSTSYTASVTASTDYRVRVICGGSGLSANSSIATVSISGPPANDSFCNPIALTLGAATVCGNTTCATSGYDPAFANSTPNNTVWYTYAPTTTGPVQVRFKRPTGVTAGLLYGWLGIYTVAGRCPGLTFTEVTSSLSYDLTTSDSVTLVTPSLTAGTNYYFMIDGFSGASGAFCIQLQTPPPVPTCTTMLAPANGATNVPNLFTLRWNKVATATSYDVYIGGTTPPTGVINATDTTLALSSNAANTTFYWYVVPKNGTGSAVGCDATIFTFTTLAAPANDSCGAAAPLTVNVATTGAITGATPSPTAAVTCGTSTYTPANDVWYTIQARSNGTASVTVTANYGSGFNPVIAVYSGTCTSPTLLSCSDASTSTTETINLTGLLAGNTYLVRVFAAGTVSNGGLTITASGPALPVTGVNLTAIRNGKSVQLGWQTLTEMNNTGFEIQRSADGSSYASLLKVASKANGGNSSAAINYTAEDAKPFSGAAYYRLKQTDKDGKINYSNVVFVKGLTVSNLTLSAVYPNPTHDVLKAAIQSPAAEKVTFVISDMMGKVISRQVSSVSNGDNTVNLNVANLPSGNYLLKAICSNGCETAVQKFTKQ